jgi:hypothetical protein
MSPTFRRWPAVLIAISVLQAGSASHLFGYAFEGYSWPVGSNVLLQLGLGAPSSGHLKDGFTTFDASAGDALANWKQYTNLINLSWSVVSGPAGQDDGRDEAFFASTVYGQSFGSGVLAITLIRYDGATTLEADNVFNSALVWDSYRGPLQYDSKKKQYIFDFHRVALHEFGHTLGLAHPDEVGQNVTAIMNSHVSDLDHIADDDVAGIRWLYGFQITSERSPYESPVGESFTYQITANNSPTTFGATGLPAGLSVDSASGLISGKPTVSGTFNVNVSATGPKGTATALVTLTISPPAFTNLIGLPTWVGNPFSFKLRATSGPTSFDATNLPDGLLIDHQTGVIHGDLIVVGEFAINVTAHTAYGDATGIFPLHVFPPTVTSSTFLDDVFTGSPLTYQITASTTQATYAATGLPAGLSLDPDTGMITGIPTLSGSYYVVLIAHTPYGDGKGYLSLTLRPPADTPDVQIPNGAEEMLADPVRPRLYLMQFVGGTIEVLDLDSLNTVATLPSDSRDFCLSADNSKLWVSYQSAITAYDLTTFSAVRTISPGIYGAYIREGAGQQMYIADYNVVSRFDLNSGAVTAVPWPGEPDYIPVMEMSADRKALFVGDSQGAPSTLVKYNVSSGSPVVAQSISQPDWGRKIVVDPTSTLLCYLSYDYPTGQGDTHYRIPLRSTTDLNTTFGFLNPNTSRAGLVAFGADGTLLFEFLQEDLRVDVYETQAMRLVRRINVDSHVSAKQMVVDSDDKHLFISSEGYPGVLGYLVHPRSTGPLTVPAHSLANVSTRTFVGTSDNVEIGGFILHGTKSKKVVMRAIAPTLASFGIARAMTDPTLEVRDARGALVASNDNWNSDRQGVLATGKAPLDEHEAVIVTSLPPGAYTAILRGIANSTGVALFELYDIDPPNSKILNISTRGNVGVGDNVMIGGFIVGGDQPTNMIVRALGPTLTDFGVSGALADPTLELHNGSGALVAQNDNWKSTQQAEIQNSGYAPPKDAEAAILATLQPGNYTAIVRGNNNTTGVALVEVYNLDAN